MVWLGEGNSAGGGLEHLTFTGEKKMVVCVTGCGHALVQITMKILVDSSNTEEGENLLFLHEMKGKISARSYLSKQLKRLTVQLIPQL